MIRSSVRAICACVHHLKLPVTDLTRSREWYRSRLGYQVQAEFVEQGQLMGVALRHPRGGPALALRLDHEHHTEPEPGQVTTIHDPRESAGRRERAAT